MEQLPDGFAIPQIQLVTRGKDQDMTNDEFVAFATKAKTGCPVFYLEAESFNPPKCKVFHGFHQQVIPSISTDCVEIHPTLTLGYG